MKGWVGLVGWPIRRLSTHISGNLSATGRAQDGESSPAIDRRSTSVPRVSRDILHTVCMCVYHSWWWRVNQSRYTRNCYVMSQYCQDSVTRDCQTMTCHTCVIWWTHLLTTVTPSMTHATLTISTNTSSSATVSTLLLLLLLLRRRRRRDDKTTKRYHDDDNTTTIRRYDDDDNDSELCRSSYWFNMICFFLESVSSIGVNTFFSL